MTIKCRFLIQLITFILFLFLSSPAIYGQTNKSIIKKIYMQLGAGPSNYKGALAEFGVQAVFKNNLTTTFSYHSITMDPKNLPADYKPGYTLIFVLPIPDGNPEQETTLYSLTGGKYFEFGKNFWLTTEAGVSMVNGNKFAFTSQPVISGGIFGYTSSNYATTKENKTTFGGMLKVDFTWAFSKFAGLGIGTFANINSIQSPIGGEIKLIVGWMNRKPNKK